MAGSLTTGLTAEMSTYYDKVFLERAQLALTYDFGAKKKTIAANMGKTVSFTRRTPLTTAPSDAIVTDETSANNVEMTSTSVTTAISTYSRYTKASQLYALTSIDEGLKEHVEVHGQNSGEVVDTIVRDELAGGGTTVVANSVAASAVAASDTIDGADLRGVYRTLFLAKAPKFSNGMYRAIAPASVKADLRADSEWLDAQRHVESGVGNIRKNIIGSLHGIEFVETNNELVVANGGASNVDLYTTFVFGEQAYAMINPAQQPGQRIFAKNPGVNSTDNPTNLFSTVGYSFHMAAKVLNSAWLIELKSASSFGANT